MAQTHTHTQGRESERELTTQNRIERTTEHFFLDPCIIYMCEFHQISDWTVGNRHFDRAWMKSETDCLFHSVAGFFFFTKKMDHSTHLLRHWAITYIEM